MNHIQELIAKVNSHGMRLEPHSGGLFVHHSRGQLSPRFAAELRAHKKELLAWLKDEHLIRQIFQGEFDGDVAAGVVADIASTLNGSMHLSANAALERLFSVGIIENHNQT